MFIYLSFSVSLCVLLGSLPARFRRLLGLNLNDTTSADLVAKCDNDNDMFELRRDDWIFELLYSLAEFFSIPKNKKELA